MTTPHYVSAVMPQYDLCDLPIESHEAVLRRDYWASRDRDTTYVFTIREGEPYVDGKLYILNMGDVPSGGIVKVKLFTEALPPWVVDGYHKLTVAGSDVRLPLEGGACIKYNDNFWFFDHQTDECETSYRAKSLSNPP